MSDDTISPGLAGLTPQQILSTYSADQWEEFIGEWAEGFAPPYAQIVRLGGPGDKGRDVVAHVTDPAERNSEWDSYQCKHYDHALAPTDVYAELGKLCWYTFDGAYSIPRKYRFVAPFAVGTTLYDLLQHPEELRASLIANWDKYCRNKVGPGAPLEGDFRRYVEEFDFRIVWFLTITDILDQHRRTHHWHRRFKLEPPVRPPAPPAPDGLLPHELRYVRCLLDAYGDHKKREFSSADQLSAEPRLERHFKRSRQYFFSAEALGRFSRDHFDGDVFTAVKNHLHDGVVDLVDAAHADGFERVQRVTDRAVSVALPASELRDYLEPADRKGLCHHLANDGRLKWCDDAD